MKGVRKLQTEDGYIVRRALNGEPEAFGLLVDRYKASIYAFAYVKLRNFHDAEDVAQEVFIKAYQKLRELRRYDAIEEKASARKRNWPPPGGELNRRSVSL